MERTVRILLVDDEERVLDACAASLSGGPYELATARDGTRALALVRSFRPDLLVLDLEMPGLSGLEVLERVTAADPTVVAIVITGAATVHAAVEAMKRGADDFLAKPFAPEAFLVVVRRGAEKRALRLEAIALRRERELFLEHFAAITSHELKAPLATVQQTLLGLEREFAAVATSDQRDRFARVKARIAELLQLIDTWLRAAVDLDASGTILGANRSFTPQGSATAASTPSTAGIRQNSARETAWVRDGRIARTSGHGYHPECFKTFTLQLLQACTAERNAAADGSRDVDS